MGIGRRAALGTRQGVSRSGLIPLTPIKSHDIPQTLFMDGPLLRSRTRGVGVREGSCPRCLRASRPVGVWGCGRMDRFVSNVTLRLDSKGRVSIPSRLPLGARPRRFRGPLLLSGARLRPAIDAGGNALMSEIEALIARYPPFSEERERFALALYGTSETLKIDGEGRVSLERDAQAACGDRARRSLSSASATSFRSGSPAGFNASSRRPPKRCARSRSELSSQAAARKARGARE